MTDSGSGTSAGIFDPRLAGEDEAPSLDQPMPDERPAQVPAQVDATKYTQIGRLAMVPSADGGVTLAGGEPPPLDEGLTSDNLVCTTDQASGREQCDYYVAFLTDADGVFKGGKRRLMQIRRFCTRMSTASELMELGSAPVHACTARKPIDARSRALIERFEDEQRRRSDEASQESADVDL